MDVAKTASVMATNTGLAVDYTPLSEKRLVFRKPGLTKILVPTTSGTGSEVTEAAIFKVRGLKTAIFGPYLLADVAVVDPSLTVTAPPRVTANTGLDALSHAIEGLMSTFRNPFSSALAIESVRRIYRSLRTAYRDGENLEARYNMSLAATMAGFSCSWLVYGHAMGNTLGNMYGIPHGQGCGVSLTYAMDINVTAIPETLALVAEAMGERVDRLTLEEAALRSVVAVKKLVEDVGVPSNLRDLGVPKEDLPKLAEQCMKIYHRPANPLKITLADCLEMYERADEGKVGT